MCIINRVGSLMYIINRVSFTEDLIGALVWPISKALDWYADDVSLIPAFGSPFSSEIVICGHCLVT